jgi:hypothetical protein
VEHQGAVLAFEPRQHFGRLVCDLDAIDHGLVSFV